LSDKECDTSNVFACCKYLEKLGRPMSFSLDKTLVCKNGDEFKITTSARWIAKFVIDQEHIYAKFHQRYFKKLERKVSDIIAAFVDESMVSIGTATSDRLLEYNGKDALPCGLSPLDLVYNLYSSLLGEGDDLRFSVVYYFEIMDTSGETDVLIRTLAIDSSERYVTLGNEPDSFMLHQDQLYFKNELGTFRLPYHFE